MIEYIEMSLKMFKEADASPRIMAKWTPANQGDFLAGFFVGQVFGTAIAILNMTNKREPDEIEKADVIRMIEGYSDEITECFSRFK